MEKKNNKTGRRIRLTPLILGVYGAVLGSGLVMVGLFEVAGGIGLIRVLLGLGMFCFGLYGIWDGVRDLVRPDKNKEKAPATQFVFTDTAGNRSSNVTPGLLREQMDILAKSEEFKSFYLQILPPLPVEGQGMLKQISCIYHDNIILVAFFEMPKDGYRILQKSTDSDRAAEWLRQLLAGNADFSEWGKMEAQMNEANTGPDEEDQEYGETDTDEENVEPFWQHLLKEQKGLMAYWHKLLIIFGESWHDEHKFFSSRDLELAIEGVHSKKYQKAVLEWGYEALHIFPGQQSDLLVVWCKNSGTEKENPRFLAWEGTVTQVKFRLVSYLEHGFLEETSGWNDITAQIEKETRKGEKKHGKVL